MPDVFTGNNQSKKTNSESAAKEKLHPVTLLNRPASKPHLFSTFCPNPIGVTFETQEPDEKIILLLRRHFITNLRWIVAGAFFLILPLLLLPLILSDDFFNILVSIPDSYVLVVTLLYYLVVIGYILTQFATWFYQVGIITHERVIDVDFNTLLSRSIAYTEIEGIVDVEVLQGGFLQGLFNYGTVDVQTEGIEANFEFTNIPEPTAVADTLSDLMRETRKRD